MTREQLDEITSRYLRETFEDIEERLALDWKDTGAARDERQWQLQEEGQRLTALLSQAEPGEFLKLAAKLLPEADDTTLRKLARRLIEAELEGIDAELAAWGGEPLKRPEAIGQRTSTSLPTETPHLASHLLGTNRGWISCLGAFRGVSVVWPIHNPQQGKCF